MLSLLGLGIRKALRLISLKFKSAIRLLYCAGTTPTMAHSIGH